MTNDVDVAVLKTEFKNVHDLMGSQTALMEKIFTQTKATNGRVNKLEAAKEAEEKMRKERKEEDDKRRFPDRIRSLENWKYGVMAVCTVIMITGYKVMTLSVGEIVRDELAIHNAEIEAKMDERIAAVLSDYEFELLQ